MEHLKICIGSCCGAGRLNHIGDLTSIKYLQLLTHCIILTDENFVLLVPKVNQMYIQHKFIQCTFYWQSLHHICIQIVFVMDLIISIYCMCHKVTVVMWFGNWCFMLRYIESAQVMNTKCSFLSFKVWINVQSWMVIFHSSVLFEKCEADRSSL